MYNSKSPMEDELPTTKQLIRSTVIAFIAAMVLLVTVVMPAEYGVDPTGIGELTGLKKMGEIKVSLEEEALQDALKASAQTAEDQNGEGAALAQSASGDVQPEMREDVMTLSLEPDEGAEIKVTLGKGQTVTYEWESTGKVNFDNHGDSRALNIDYYPYGEGLFQPSDAGKIEAAFDGNHGWFWRNRTNETVTITITTRGPYSWIGLVD